ncbi:unnamed protein product [Allacma fusca]|uniref:Uncharacterized protein n=1 Tax=Allacma fusca TaxID=39272 RepID=A0A8J2NXM1_9HEXA|nr:unnamed protein product [Allacma fusca]
MSWQNLMRKGKISYDHNFFTILLALLLFLILPCLYKCDNIYDYPTLNKCCPQGSFYNEGKDVCVELSAGLKEDFKVQDNSFPTDMTGDNFISVPSDLVIDLSNKSSTPEDFRFRSKYGRQGQRAENTSFSNTVQYKIQQHRHVKY